MIRIMIVDDVEHRRSLNKRVLNHFGIRKIDLAASGEEALRRLREPYAKHPDLIICELRMDGTDGMELCNSLRRDKLLRRHGIPVLMMVDEVIDQLTREVTRQVGAKTILTRPVSPLDLLVGIQSIVGIALV